MGIRCIGRSKLSCGHTLIGVKVLGRCGEDDGYGCCPGAMRFAAGAAFSETRTGARSLQGGMRFSGGDRKWVPMRCCLRLPRYAACRWCRGGGCTRICRDSLAGGEGGQ